VVVANVGSKILRVVASVTGEILHGDFRMKKIAKGRRIGEQDNHPNAILTDGEVELVRQLREVQGMTYDAIAAKMDVSEADGRTSGQDLPVQFRR
jgi:hypothetical protein